MKLLLSYGADPNIWTMKPPANLRFQQGGTRSGDASDDGTGRPPVPTGGPDIPPLLLAAAGTGYAALPPTRIASRPPACSPRSSFSSTSCTWT